MPVHRPPPKEKHKFEEERARLLLELYFPRKYEHSTLSESPDIIDTVTGVGVEVTDSLRQHVQEGLSRAGDITGKAEDALDRTNRENIAAGRVTAQELPNGQMLAAFSFWGDTHDIWRAYFTKTKKLNLPHFQKFQENNLFIYAWMIDSEELEKGIEHIVVSKQSDFGLSEKESISFLFDSIHIHRRISS